MRATIRRTAPLLLLLTSASFGYIRLTTNSTPAFPLLRFDNTGIQFNLNSQIVAGFQSNASGQNVTIIAANTNPQTVARAALSTWNAVGANVNFLPLQTTSNGADPTDGVNSIVVASTTAEISAVGGALAITLNTAVTVAGLDPDNTMLTVAPGNIIDSDILLNPAATFSSDGSTNADFQAVLTHELGHALGLDHTGVLGATMFQAPVINARILTSDDLAFANSVYPSTSSAPALGTISGTITSALGPAPYAMLAFIDTTQGISIGGLTNPDGTYSVQVPPGNYYVYTEPYNAVQPGNLYLTTVQAALVATFQPTLLGGTASPTKVTVTANNTATANLTVTPGVSALALPYIGIGAAGGNGDITTLSKGAPVQIASGQSVDIGLNGIGFDSTLTGANVTVYGAGISVGAVHVDNKVNVGGLPLIRVTLTIAARQTPALATILITKGSSTLTLTGILVVVPPTPSFIAPKVFSATEDVTGIVGNGTVSPGEYVTLLGTGVSPASGPYFGVGYAATAYLLGYLPQNLGGTSVTFDGIPAPIFFTGVGGSGPQINLQVPFEVAGKTSTQVVVSFFGSPSAPITLPVVPVHPALFTFPAAPSVYAANYNSDGSLTTNGSGSVPGVTTAPAAPGGLIIVVGTGFGLPSYAGSAYPIQTGAPAPVPPAANQNSNGWTATIGGVSAPIVYAAYFNAFTAEAEWYVTVPASLTTTGAVPIVITSPTGVSTQSDLTVFIK